MPTSVCPQWRPDPRSCQTGADNLSITSACVSYTTPRDTIVILFVGFDGVLHPAGDALGFTCTPFLWKLLRLHPEVRVVLTTDLRAERDFDDLLYQVTQYGGEDLFDQFIDCTPRLRSQELLGRRERECLAWLNQRQAAMEGWLALDDKPELFLSLSHLYLVNQKTGLTERDVSRLHSVLRSRV